MECPRCLDVALGGGKVCATGMRESIIPEYCRQGSEYSGTVVYFGLVVGGHCSWAVFSAGGLTAWCLYSGYLPHGERNISMELVSLSGQSSHVGICCGLLCHAGEFLVAMMLKLMVQ